MWPQFRLLLHLIAIFSKSNAKNLEGSGEGMETNMHRMRPNHSP
jgi:hypothetical protein